MTRRSTARRDKSSQGEEPPIRTFSVHCRKRYGTPVGKIAIDTGQLCPNRQLGGCIYCKAASFTPEYLLHDHPVNFQIKKGKERLHKNGFKHYFAYFQQETCTAMEPGRFLEIIDGILPDQACLGLIVSTRPDYLEDSLLLSLYKRIHSSGKECLFELGLQSIHDKSLKLLNRNHTFQDFSSAVSRIQEAGVFDVGAHLIFGIPGESTEEMLTSLETVCSLGINALKLHHLQVIRGTVLHEMYDRGEVEVFSLDEYTQFLLTALQIIPAHIVIHRLWSSSHPEMLAAPKWNILATHLSRELHRLMREDNIRQGIRSGPTRGVF